MSDECKPDYRTDFGTLNQICADAKVGSVRGVQGGDGRGRIEIAISYREAEGKFMISSGDGKSIAIEYLFRMKQEINPRQWGVVVSVPMRFEKLTWVRRGQWTAYPDDHIARPAGDAVAGATARPSAFDLRKPPIQAWRFDANELGTNDFRSTKTNVIRASLVAGRGEMVIFVPDTTHAVRAYADKGAVQLLAAAFTTGGGEGFFSPHYSAERRPLKAGDVIRDRIVLTFGSGSKGE
jgi:hypothetical protein